MKCLISLNLIKQRHLTKQASLISKPYVKHPYSFLIFKLVECKYPKKVYKDKQITINHIYFEWAYKHIYRALEKAKEKKKAKKDNKKNKGNKEEEEEVKETDKDNKKKQGEDEEEFLIDKEDKNKTPIEKEEIIGEPECCDLKSEKELAKEKKA